MTLVEASQLVRNRKISSVELVQQCLSRLDQTEPKLKAFITVTGEQALEQARMRDAELARGQWRGPLHGVPIAVKDVFWACGTPTTGGSPLFADYVPEENAAAVEALLRAGAVLLGKTNLHELAYGITSSNPHFGTVRNPWDLERIPGGSSGGSAAAVAAHMVFAALGSDTGGSIRIPAAFCGIVGLKPTFGWVSRYGMLPLGFTLDHVGPLTRSTRDAALIMECLVGWDPRDPFSSPEARFREPVDGPITFRQLRLGIPTNFFWDRVEPAVLQAVHSAITQASQAGATLVELEAPAADVLVDVGRVILLAEAATVFEQRLSEREKFGRDVWLLLQQGRLIPATTYLQAQRLRGQLIERWKSLWREVDCLITPSTPILPARIGDHSIRWHDGTVEDLRQAATRFVRPFNVLGLPAVSIPCGFSPEGLPVGLQLVGPWGADGRLLAIAGLFEEALGLSDLQPPAL